MPGVSKGDLIRKARELGIRVDGSWPPARLLAAIQSVQGKRAYRLVRKFTGKESKNVSA